MARQGRLSVRDVPEYSTSERNTYHSLLKRFFDKYTICPRCKGEGKRRKVKDSATKEYATISYEGIKELERLKERGENVGDHIRSIIRHVAWGEKVCSACNGFGYVTKENARLLIKEKNAARGQRGKKEKGTKKKRSS